MELRGTQSEFSPNQTKGDDSSSTSSKLWSSLVLDVEMTEICMASRGSSREKEIGFSMR